MSQKDWYLLKIKFLKAQKSEDNVITFELKRKLKLKVSIELKVMVVMYVDLIEQV